MQVAGGGVDLFGLFVLARARQRHRDAVRGRRRDAAAHDAGRPADADAGVPRAVPRAGLRAARPARGLDPRGRAVNPVTALLEAGRDLISGPDTRGWSRTGSRWSRCSWSSPCAGCAAQRSRRVAFSPRRDRWTPSASTPRTSRSRPSALLDARAQAEAAGFERALSSDHFSPVERAPGRVRLRLVVAGRRAAGDLAAVRRRQRARAALPPGDHRAGDRHAGRDVPRAGSGSRSAAARRPTSTSPASRGRDKPMRNARLRECVDVIRALFAGEEVDHRRPRHRRPGPAVDAARASRRRCSAPR